MRKIIIAFFACTVLMTCVLPSEVTATTSEPTHVESPGSEESSDNIRTTDFPGTAETMSIDTNTNRPLDPAMLSAVMSSFTAIAAIVAPVVSSFITIRSQEKMKKTEIYYPRIYDALSEMTATYSCLIRRSIVKVDDWESENVEFHEAMIRYQSFMAACYKVMSLIANEHISQQIFSLLTDIKAVSYCPWDCHDRQFAQLMNEINDNLQT